MDKKIFILGFLILLASCSFLRSKPQIDNNFQDENSKIITLLITDQELSEISKDFVWKSIKSEQGRYPQTNGMLLPYEVASRMYRGYYKTSDSSIIVWHTIKKHDQPIDINKLSLPEFGVSTDEITSSYFPEINTSGHVTAQCGVYRGTMQFCQVGIAYSYIESGIYISPAEDYGEETMSQWLNAIVTSLEPRILSQDTPE